MLDRRRTQREFPAKESLPAEDDDFPDGVKGFAGDFRTFLGVPTLE
jgi:hypothetical protein